MKSRKKERGREVSMQKLMKAGVEVFSEFGFNGATTRMLSQRSGINESLINRYFEGKSGLFLAIILDFIRRSKENELNYARGENVEQEIENYLRFQYEEGLAGRDFMRIVLSRVAVDSKIRDQVNDYVCKMLESDCSSVVIRLREFQKSGHIRKDVDVVRAARAIGIQEMGYKFMISVLPEIDRKEAFAEFKLFAKVFSRGLSP